MNDERFNEVLGRLPTETERMMFTLGWQLGAAPYLIIEADRADMQREADALGVTD